MPFGISSPAFEHQAAIPTRYTRDGDNVSPPLEWHDAPPQTRSFALIVEDPDAPSGTFRHWVVYNMASGETGLAEGASTSGPGHLDQGVNGFGDTHYDGPQPPRGHGVHHYHFRLAALDVPRLELKAPIRAEAVWQAARRHIIAETELVGTYVR